jgi:hypothetical protein
MLYKFADWLNHAPRICKEKLSGLWISCVYLWAILWFPTFTRQHATPAWQPLRLSTMGGKPLKSRLFKQVLRFPS